MSCEFAHHDGSYVLGALAPSERLEFERHMTQCDDCSRSVRELAGLPGLLSQVDPADLDATAAPPLPSTILPALVRDVRTSQRRRTTIVAGVAAAVAAVAVGSAALTADVLRRPEVTAGPTPTSVTSTVPARAMDAVGATPVRADVRVAGVSWGTKLDMTCTYEQVEEGYEASPDAVYALVVRTTDGRTEQVATWKGLPGRTMRVSGATATNRQDIDTVELRTAGGILVLQLTV